MSLKHLVFSPRGTKNTPSTPKGTPKKEMYREEAKRGLGSAIAQEAMQKHLEMTARKRKSHEPPKSELQVVPTTPKHKSSESKTPAINFVLKIPEVVQNRPLKRFSFSIVDCKYKKEMDCCECVTSFENSLSEAKIEEGFFADRIDFLSLLYPKYATELHVGYDLVYRAKLLEYFCEVIKDDMTSKMLKHKTARGKTFRKTIIGTKPDYEKLKLKNVIQDYHDRLSIVIEKKKKDIEKKPKILKRTSKPKENDIESTKNEIVADSSSDDDSQDDEKHGIQFYTVDEIIFKCVGSDVLPDADLVVTAALCLCTYSSPSEIIEKLIKQVEEQKKKSNNAARNTEVVKRAMQFLSECVAYTFEHFNEKHIEEVTRLFNLLPSNQISFASLARLERKAYDQMVLEKEKLKAQQYVLSSISSFSKIDFTTLQSSKKWKPEEIAKQLTLIEFEMFSMIRTSEFFNQAWLKSDREIRAPNITAITQRFNWMSLWIISSILKGEKSKVRAKTLSEFVNLAWCCYQLNNFSGMFEIVSALYSTPIFRLQKTWGKLDKSLVQKCEQLQHITNIANNYRNYRDALQKAKKPVLPNIALHLRDLAAIEAMDSTKQVDNQIYINISKRELLTQTIKTMLEYQKSGFNFKPDKAIQNYLWWQILQFSQQNVTQLNKDYLTLSKKLEPRQS